MFQEGRYSGIDMLAKPDELHGCIVEYHSFKSCDEGTCILCDREECDLFQCRVWISEDLLM
jgi:hypothetical protein